MKRTIIAVLSIILIVFAFTACLPTTVIVPVPDPDNPIVTPDPDPEPEPEPDTPSLSGDTEKGEVFADSFDADSSSYYNPTLINKNFKGPENYNMVIEEGVAKLYGGGAYIHFDNDPSNNPSEGIDSDLNYDYELNLNNNTYKLAYSLKLEEFDLADFDSGFFGIESPIVRNGNAVAAGVRFYKNGTNDGLLLKPVSADAAAEGIAVDRDAQLYVEVTYSRVSTTSIQAATKVRINDGNWFVLSNTSRNIAPDAVTGIYLTVMGPYTSNDYPFAVPGDLCMILDDVILSESEVSDAS